MLFCFRCCYLCIGLAVVVVSSILVSLFMRHGVGHSILVLLFMQHANNVGWHFDFGLGVAFFSMTLLVPPFFQCLCCCLWNNPVVLVIALFLQLWCHCLCNALVSGVAPSILVLSFV